MSESKYELGASCSFCDEFHRASELFIVQAVHGDGLIPENYLACDECYAAERLAETIMPMTELVPDVPFPFQLPLPFPETV